MKVKALTNCCGIKFSMVAGEVVDLDDSIAKDLIRAGYVETTTPAPKAKEAEAKAEPKKTEAKKRTTKK